jgi:hypothetical protein
MSTEIEQIEDMIITEIKRTTDRPGYPVIGIADCTTWSAAEGDVEPMLQAILSNAAARVIFADSKPEPLKVLGGGPAHDETAHYRIVLIVSNLRGATPDDPAGYTYLEAIKKCFTKFDLAPVKGFLWPTTVELLMIKYGKFAYKLEFEKRSGA